MADFIARVAADQNRPLGHSLCAAAVGGAAQMAGPAPDVDHPAVHLAANPVAGVTQNVNFAAPHFATDMTAGAAMHDDLTRLHLCPDPVNARQVPLPLMNSIRR